MSQDYIQLVVSELQPAVCGCSMVFGSEAEAAVMLRSSGPARVEIMAIGVLPAHRGRGIGSALLNALCDIADRTGTVLTLGVGQPKIGGWFVGHRGGRAMAWYKRFGFVVDNTYCGGKLIRAPRS